MALDILKMFGRSQDETRHVRDRPYQDRRYFIGSDRLAALGWEPRTSWEEGLRATIEWYSQKGNIDRWDETALAAALQWDLG